MDAKVFVNENRGYGFSRTSYNIYVLQTLPSKDFMLFSYPSVDGDKYNSFLNGEFKPVLPNDIRIINDVHKYHWKQLTSKTPECLNLVVDFPATHEKAEYERKIVGDVTEEEISEIDAKKQSVRICTGYSFEPETKIHYLCIPENKEVDFPVCQETYISHINSWMYFKERDSVQDLFIDRVKKNLSDSKIISYYGSSSSNKYTIFSKSSDGIFAKTVQKTIKSKCNKVILEYKLIYSFEFSLKNGFACYKHYVRGGKVKCESAFKEIGINSVNLGLFSSTLYPGYESFVDFAIDNEELLRNLGFMRVLARQKAYCAENTFLIFLALLCEYPILEQLIKMGHMSMYSSIHDSIVAGESREQIRKKVADISIFLNTETSKGKDAFRFPKYIGDYLISENAPTSDYYAWMNIYEITRISKENFENYVNSFPFLWLHSELSYNSNDKSAFDQVSNILKFGYGLEKLTKYIIKQSRKSGNNANFLITELTDYLNMCDLMEVNPDYYPKDLIEIHDKMAAAFKAKENEFKDKQLKEIADECASNAIPEDISAIGVPKGFEEYTIVFPSSIKAFIDEGNQQHNCVGGYYARVIDGRSVVFFIRSKETPCKSFVTAECRGSGLTQCYYSNNRRVTDEKIISVAKYVCRKILQGINSGKINALSKEKSR